MHLICYPYSDVIIGQAKDKFEKDIYARAESYANEYEQVLIIFVFK